MKLLEFIHHMDEAVTGIAESVGGRYWSWSLYGDENTIEHETVGVVITGQARILSHDDADDDGWVKFGSRHLVSLPQASRLRDEDKHLPWTTLSAEMTVAFERMVGKRVVS